MKVRIGDAVEDIRAVWFGDGAVRMIDQRRLPHELAFAEFRDHLEVAEAIRNMTTRGAPSIGAAAAYGMCLAAISGQDLKRAAADIKAARPTAYDLFYAVDHMERALKEGEDPVASADGYAQAIVDRCTAIGKHGDKLIKKGSKVMTHCNAGALATVDVGTALAPIREAHRNGKGVFVYVSETRPRLQGMQLTAWEMVQEGIPHRVIADGASGHFMKEGVDMVITGADRIAANGDFANKIGTYDKAVIAKELGIPFYVAAPISTFDFGTETGKQIIIEERDGDEVTCIAGVRIAPVGTSALNPSFDVTDSRYVTAFITEKGVLRPDEISEMAG